MKYDVVVIGAGPGGYVAAIRAAQLGARTALVEKEYIGGTCLNVGCIPTKALIKNVEILHEIDLGKKRGIKIDGEIKLDYAKAVKAKDKACKQLVNGVSGLLASNGIDVISGTARPKADHTIQITKQDGTTENIEYKKLILANGSRPAFPPIPGIESEGIVTSTEMLAMTELPKHLVIVGAGVIGCEFATIYSRYGVEITMIEMLPNAVDVLDDSISAAMNGILENQGVQLMTNTAVKSFKKNDDGSIDVIVEKNSGEQITVNGDKVLVSIGRLPNTEGLDELGLEMNGKFISINDKLETSVPDVYAIGDVTGKKQLAHVASDMGTIAAENAMGADHIMSYDIIPSCIYTIPEVASVGLSEQEAKENGIEYVTGNFPLVGCGKAVATGVADGNFKIIADAKTKKILGAHLVGHGATEIIAEIAAYMKMEATVDDVISTIHSHPTISESVAEAARDVYGITIHMPKKN